MYADHVFFDLIDYYTEDKRAVDTSVQVALELLLQDTPFTVGRCDDLGIATAYFIEENKLKSINDKIIPRWNCEIEIDNFTVTAKKRIGQDRNYHIRRGKNLKGINYREDMSNVVTRLYAKGYDGLTFEDINGGKRYVDSPLIDKYAHIKAGDHHFSDIEDKKELLEAAKEHILTIDKPYIHYDIDLVELRDSDDYEHFKELETFNLGDTVYVYNDKLDIDINARILEYEYNPKRRQNSVVVLGNFTQRLEDTLGQFEDTKRKVDNSITDEGYVRTSRLQGVIDALTNKIVASGAYHHSQVIEDKGLLFENTDETSNDFGAMYIGPGIFSIASDKKADGSWNWTTFGTGKGFVADHITSGTLLASLIKVGGSGQPGILNVRDENDDILITLDKEGIKLSNGATMIGGSGVISVLNFISAGEYAGYQLVGMIGSDFGYGFIERAHIPIFIPDRFKVERATLYLSLIPTYQLHYDQPLGFFHGKNLKLYKSYDSEDMCIVLPFQSEWDMDIGLADKIDITNDVFGINKISPTGDKAQIYSGDITNHLQAGTRMFLTLETTDDLTDSYHHMGGVKFEIYVEGYKS